MRSLALALTLGLALSAASPPVLTPAEIAQIDLAHSEYYKAFSSSKASLANAHVLVYMSYVSDRAIRKIGLNAYGEQIFNRILGEHARLGPRKGEAFIAGFIWLERVVNSDPSIPENTRVAYIQIISKAKRDIQALAIGCPEEPPDPDATTY